jgi:hypothetical protein
MTQPRTLLMIRHGEKPSHGDTGVDAQGNAHPGGLVPRGWERAGALVALFAPNAVTLSSALPRPGALVSPRYSDPVHRPGLTLLPLSQRLGLAIRSEHPVGCRPAKVVKSLLAIEAGVVLLCWEHDHLVAIAYAMAAAVPVANPAEVPACWPGDRFDVIWRFDLDEQAGIWTFGSLDQQLLAGDVDSAHPNVMPVRP